MDYSFLIHCSNCKTPLLDVWVIKDTEQITKVRATCPYCGDKSFWKDVQGKFAVSGTDKTELSSQNYDELSLEVKCERK